MHEMNLDADSGATESLSGRHRRKQRKRGATPNITNELLSIMSVRVFLGKKKNITQAFRAWATSTSSLRKPTKTKGFPRYQFNEPRYWPKAKVMRIEAVYPRVAERLFLGVVGKKGVGSVLCCVVGCVALGCVFVS